MKRNKWILAEEADDGSGASASAGAPAATPLPEEPVVQEEFGADWGDLAEDLPEEEVGEEPPAEASAEPEAGSAPAEAPERETAAEQSLQPAEVAPTQPTQEQLVAQEALYRQQLERGYSFDDQTALRLQTEPEKVLPALAAQLHLDVMRNVMAQVQTMVPQMVQQVNTSSAREAKAQDMFYGAFPELRAHEAQVLQMGEVYRRMNPTASADEAVQGIGNLTMAALGMVRTPAAAVAPVPVAPYRPAVPGRRGAPVQMATEWDSLIDDE